MADAPTKKRLFASDHDPNVRRKGNTKANPEPLRLLRMARPGAHSLPSPIEQTLLSIQESLKALRKAGYENTSATIGVLQKIETRLVRKVKDVLQSRETLGVILDSIPVMVCIYNARGQILLVNREFRRRIGWSLAELQHIDLMAECYPDPSYRAQVWKYMQSATVEWRDIHMRTRNGDFFDSAWTNVRLSDGTQIGLGIDISERIRSEKALQALTLRTLDALENDRKTVAKELHDSVGAGLAAIKFALEGRLAATDAHTADRDGGMSFQEIVDQLAAVIKETKRISSKLRPPVLEELGFFSALYDYIRQFRKFYPAIRAGIEFDVTEEEISERHQLVLYRLIQEALNNVAKHSGADRVQINIAGQDGRICLQVQDNGCGFDLAGVQENSLSGFGLKSMEDRVRICGGTFLVDSNVGKGTLVEAVFPPSDEGQEDHRQNFSG